MRVYTGPTLGSVLIEMSGSVLLPFYVALSLHILYFLLIIFFLPESLSQSRQLGSRTRFAATNIEKSIERAGEDEIAKTQFGQLTILRIKRVLATPLWFLKPLGIFLPSRRGEKGEEEREVPVLESRLKIRKGLNWELTKIGSSYAVYYMVIVSVLHHLSYFVEIHTKLCK